MLMGIFCSKITVCPGCNPLGLAFAAAGLVGSNTITRTILSSEKSLLLMIKVSYRLESKAKIDRN
jgi:hypothetical protein